MNEADQPQIVKGLYQLHIDGGKKASTAGEKGLGAYGFVLCDPRGTELPGGAQGEVVGPVADPHSAEYEALLAGLSLARQLEIKYIAVFSDSRTLVNQVNRLWNSSGHLSEYREKAWNALAEFAGWQMSWIPRKWNERADKRVDEAFASAAPGGEITHAED
jgi:ribonuclease HI